MNPSVGPHTGANVGAPGGPTVAAFDTGTGKEVWRAGTMWGPSYASPVPAVVHGQRRVFVFAGGESSPPTGGLMSIDPANGRVDFSFPWRSRSYESVNASCPVVFGARRTPCPHDAPTGSDSSIARHTAAAAPGSD